MTTPTRSSYAALLALALAACGARGTGGSFLTTADGGASSNTDGGASSNTDGGASSNTDAGNPITPGTCNQICRRLRDEPSCGADGAASCENNCEESIVAAPSRCASSVSALLACARTAAPMCSPTTQFPFPSCAPQFSAYASCVVSAATDAGTVTPPRDSGPTADPCATATNCASCTARSSCGWCANRCWTGSSEGPTGGSCGDSSWAWTSGMCSSSPPPQDSGVSPTITPACQGCAVEACASEVPACLGDTTCAACLTAPTPACAENPRFAALFSCACESCEACEPACGSFR